MMYVHTKAKKAPAKRAPGLWGVSPGKRRRKQKLIVTHEPSQGDEQMFVRLSLLSLGKPPDPRARFARTFLCVRQYCTNPAGQQNIHHAPYE